MADMPYINFLSLLCHLYSIIMAPCEFARKSYGDGQCFILFLFFQNGHFRPFFGKCVTFPPRQPRILCPKKVQYLALVSHLQFTFPLHFIANPSPIVA